MDYLAHYEKSARMWSQGLHAHDYYEIYLHLEGARLYCIDDIVYELSPNQLLVIPPLHMHGLICDRDLVDYERCYLYLSPELLGKCGLGKIDLAKMIDTAYKNHSIVCSLTREEAAQCKEHLQTIEQLSNSFPSEKSLEIFSRILSFLQIVSDALLLCAPSFSPMPANHSILGVLHYINDHYTENITVESISREFHISESSLSHKFKEYVNKGIYEYILYKRIIKAKELMYTDCPLTEISYLCGFSDYSNFLRVFKKNTGESPRVYRKNIYRYS